MSWRDAAACGGTSGAAHFPEKGESNKLAKEICADCPVTELCLDWAMTHHEDFGVWGGLSARERRNGAPRRSRAPGVRKVGPLGYHMGKWNRQPSSHG